MTTVEQLFCVYVNVEFMLWKILDSKDPKQIIFPTSFSLKLYQILWKFLNYLIRTCVNCSWFLILFQNLLILGVFAFHLLSSDFFLSGLLWSWVNLSPSERCLNGKLNMITEKQIWYDSTYMRYLYLCSLSSYPIISVIDFHPGPRHHWLFCIV